MCGIFALLGSKENPDEHFKKGSKRGPEFSKLLNYNGIYLGFHRLAINGLNEESNQPMYYGNSILICNGEIFNYKELIILFSLENKQVFVYLQSRWQTKLVDQNWAMFSRQKRTC